MGHTSKFAIGFGTFVGVIVLAVLIKKCFCKKEKEFHIGGEDSDMS
ncbi:hypothetical protein FPSE_06264 [Fusarium pseudograminearum CS3096]|uniref:Uncharacterized protein n=1 Tax=Fusarium pseudograminearum (strain CS3096) TaxID=1028729 RepID=K3UN72_FUSPC|nr:hypothetical protein FPSE_06264 [Fusarium pseudograminearum CS3096]EKJ73646.1 hypothetical protein FPSE_06264 [Fusarium pseudograminearum CS3096]